MTCYNLCGCWERQLVLPWQLVTSVPSSSSSSSSPSSCPLYSHSRSVHWEVQPTRCCSAAAAGMPAGCNPTWAGSITWRHINWTFIPIPGTGNITSLQHTGSWGHYYPQCNAALHDYFQKLLKRTLLKKFWKALTILLLLTTYRSIGKDTFEEVFKGSYHTRKLRN